MEADTGRVVAMASQPTYDPARLGRRHQPAQLERLYADEAGQPAARPGDPGPVRARLDLEADHDASAALDNGFTPDTGSTAPPGCRSATGGSRTTSRRRYGYIGFDQALQISCDTFFYRVGLQLLAAYGTDPTDVDARDPLVEGAKKFGFGKETGIDLPGEAAAGSPTGSGSSPTGSR